MSKNENIVFGGLEGGATKSVLILLDNNGQQLLTKTGPGTNLWLTGIEKCAEIITTLIQSAKQEIGADSNIPLKSLGLALSGCEANDANFELLDALKKLNPNLAETYTISSDVLAPAGLVLSKGGIVFISGTGSNALLVTSDGSVISTCGGLGYLMGDQGSGFTMSEYGFCEMNLLCPKSRDVLKVKMLIHKAISVGYNTVVLNTTINDEQLSNARKRKIADNQPMLSVIPSPLDISISSKEIMDWQNSHQKIPKILQRLTIKLHDTSKAHLLTSLNALSFDLITFDLSTKTDFHLNPSHYKLAMTRGIHFELCYSHLFTSSLICQNAISWAHELYSFGQGKNIIMSSSSDLIENIHGPYDVINLGMLFGLNDQQARDAIVLNCRKAIIHGLSRKSGRSIITIKDVSELSEGEKWVVEEIKNILKY